MDPVKLKILKSYGLNPEDHIRIQKARLCKLKMIKIEHALKKMCSKDSVHKIKLWVRNRYAPNGSGFYVWVYKDPTGKFWETDLTTIDGKPIKNIPREKLILVPEVYSEKPYKMTGLNHPMTKKMIEKWIEHIKQKSVDELAGHIAALSTKTPKDMAAFVSQDISSVVQKIIEANASDTSVLKEFGIDMKTDEFVETFIGNWSENMHQYMHSAKMKIKKGKDRLLLDITGKLAVLLIKITPHVLRENKKKYIAMINQLMNKKVEVKKIHKYIHTFWKKLLGHKLEEMLADQNKNLFSFINSDIPNVSLPEPKKEEPKQKITTYIGAFMEDEEDFKINDNTLPKEEEIKLDEEDEEKEEEEGIESKIGPSTPDRRLPTRPIFSDRRVRDIRVDPHPVSTWFNKRIAPVIGRRRLPLSPIYWDRPWRRPAVVRLPYATFWNLPIMRTSVVTQNPLVVSPDYWTDRFSGLDPNVVSMIISDPKLLNHLWMNPANALMIVMADDAGVRRYVFLQPQDISRILRRAQNEGYIRLSLSDCIDATKDEDVDDLQLYVGAPIGGEKPACEYVRNGIVSEKCELSKIESGFYNVLIFTKKK